MSPESKCVVCGRSFVHGTRFDLTPEEKVLIGPDAPDYVDYCASCLRVTQNLQQGANLIKGMYEKRLREQGIPNASGIATAFHKWLTQKATRKMQ